MTYPNSHIVNRLASLVHLEGFEGAKSGLISVGDVKEAIGITFLLVDLRHQGVSLEQVLPVHKEVQRVLLRQLYSLANDVVEVIGCQVVRHEVPIQIE